MAVTPEQIGVELGVTAPTSTQLAQWESWIDQAMYLIGKRLDIGTLDPADVDYVVLQAVTRHAGNPQNATQVTKSVDDGSVSRTYSSGQGRVSIWDELWELLDPSMASEAFTIMTGPSAPPVPLVPQPWQVWP